MRLIVTIFASLLASSVIASEQEAKLSKLAWSAFECHKLAEMAGEDAEKDRLFAMGMKAATGFTDAWKAGRITENERFNFVPGGIYQAASGPSAEFIPLSSGIS